MHSVFVEFLVVSISLIPLIAIMLFSARTENKAVKLPAYIKENRGTNGQACQPKENKTDENVYHFSKQKPQKRLGKDVKKNKFEM